MKAPRLTNVVETGFEGEIDALNERIRQLEDESGLASDLVEALQERIRQLEAQLKEADEHIPYLERCEQESIKRGARVEELSKRIQRAREILKTLDQRAYIVMVKQALEALEGK